VCFQLAEAPFWLCMMSNRKKQQRQQAAEGSRSGFSGSNVVNRTAKDYKFQVLEEVFGGKAFRNVDDAYYRLMEEMGEDMDDWPDTESEQEDDEDPDDHARSNEGRRLHEEKVANHRNQRLKIRYERKLGWRFMMAGADMKEWPRRSDILNCTYRVFHALRTAPIAQWFNPNTVTVHEFRKRELDDLLSYSVPALVEDYACILVGRVQKIKKYLNSENARGRSFLPSLARYYDLRSDKIKEENSTFISVTRQDSKTRVDAVKKAFALRRESRVPAASVSDPEPSSAAEALFFPSTNCSM